MRISLVLGACSAVVGLLLLVSLPTRAAGAEAWVQSIRSSSQWAMFPCKNYLVTNVCGTDKDYSDPGLLPPVISVGDTVEYVTKDGKRKQFVVRHINLFVYDRDLDTTYGGQRFTALKGDTSCTLYDVKNRSATRDTEYPSRLVIKGCTEAH